MNGGVALQPIGGGTHPPGHTGPRTKQSHKGGQYSTHPTGIQLLCL